MNTNNISNWFANQLVTADEMNAQIADVYQRFTGMTEFAQGTILSLAGDAAIDGGNVNVPAGSFRFPDSSASYLPYPTGIFGNAAAAVVPWSGDGYIVARYSISPGTPNATNYIITVTYMFVASVVVPTDCIICFISSGVIQPYYSYTLINSSSLQENVPVMTDDTTAVTPYGLAAVFGNNFGFPIYVVEAGIGANLIATAFYVKGVYNITLSGSVTLNYNSGSTYDLTIDLATYLPITNIATEYIGVVCLVSNPTGMATANAYTNTIASTTQLYTQVSFLGSVSSPSVEVALHITFTAT